MLFLPRQPLEDVDHLRTALGNAVAVELGTIPPYLTALFSVKPGRNAEAAAIVRSVAIEEMLHLSLACNMLNAVGGRPDLPAAVLRYPSPLPMGIGDKPPEHPGGQPREFIVPLARLSRASVKKTFMTIEEPEHPLDFPDAAMDAAAPEYHTIGEFYTAVGRLMHRLGEGIFTGAKERQVTGWIGVNRLHAVYRLDDALEAIKLIVEQGEGTPKSPAPNPEELAHYYRFEQIARKKTLNPDPSAPDGYSWGKPAVNLDDDGVFPMAKNPTRVRLPKGSEVARMSDQFDATYTALIDDLQRTFDGAPHIFGSAMAQMHALRLQARQLVAMDVPGREGRTAGPRFRYVG